MFQTPSFGGAASTGGSLFGSTQKTFALGAPAATSAGGTGLFSFAQPTTTTRSGGLFGAVQPATTTKSMFGGTVGGGLFSSTLPTSTTVTSGTGYSFSQPVPSAVAQQQQQPVAHSTDEIQKQVKAVTRPEVYGDERDGTIARLNQCQAFVGQGKAFYYAGQPPVEFSKFSPYFAFNAIVYNQLPSSRDDDGLVGLTFLQSATSTEAIRQPFCDQLYKIFGAKPHLQANIESIRPLPDDRCEVTIFVTESNQVGVKRRLTATEVACYLNQLKAELNSIGIANVCPKIGFDSTQLNGYLATPPPGVDPTLWEQAKRNNPNPTVLIPYPLRGFTELNSRRTSQQQENQLQQGYMQKIQDLVGTLNTRRVDLDSRLALLKAKQSQLSHRILRVAAMQNIKARQGYTVDPIEEEIRGILEMVNIRLNAPGQLKGRFEELIAVTRMRPDVLQRRGGTKIDGDRSPDGGRFGSLTEDTELMGACQRQLGRFQDRLEDGQTQIDANRKDLCTMIDLLASATPATTHR